MYGSVVIHQSAFRQHRRAGTKPALVGAAIDLVLAAGLGALRATNGSIGERHVEGPLPTLAIVLALAAPGIVAVIGVVIDRPVLFGAAGISCLPLVIVSIAAVPIWIAGALFMVAFARSTSGQRSLSLLGGLVLVGFQAPILVGLWILITETQQYTYNFTGGSEGGDYFTPGHGLLCIALVALDLFVVTLLARLSPPPRA